MERGDGRDFPVNDFAVDSAALSQDHPLCGECIEWLAGVVANLAAPQFARGALLGSPNAWSRVRVFPDQCQLCKEMLGDDAVLASSVTLSGGTAILPPMLICGACDSWIAGLADDGRSARGEAARAIDGSYGLWPHPNLRNIQIELHIRERGMEQAIRESCAQMGVGIAANGAVPGSVLMIEATETDSAAWFLRSDQVLRRGRIVLSRLAAEDDLKVCVGLGINDWLTLPVTPQQVSAALALITRQAGLKQRWDAVFALPAIDLRYLARPALAITPAAGVRPFEAAWFVKRVKRGYDDLGVSNGIMILAPRAPADALERVAERMARALSSRCQVNILDRRTMDPQHLEAAG